MRATGSREMNAAKITKRADERSPLVEGVETDAKARARGWWNVAAVATGVGLAVAAVAIADVAQGRSIASPSLRQAADVEPLVDGQYRLRSVGVCARADSSAWLKAPNNYCRATADGLVKFVDACAGSDATFNVRRLAGETYTLSLGGKLCSTSESSFSCLLDEPGESKPVPEEAVFIIHGFSTYTGKV